MKKPSIEIVTALLQLALELAPQVQEDLQKGNVTPEQQAALQATVADVFEHGFSGPEWQKSTG